MADSIEHNGNRVTSIRFERSMSPDGSTPTYNLRFFDGRRIVDRAERLSSEATAKLLGDENFRAMNALAPDPHGETSGVLKGDSLNPMQPSQFTPAGMPASPAANVTAAAAANEANAKNAANDNTIEPDRELDKDVKQWVEKRWGERSSAPAAPVNDDPFAAESSNSVADVNSTLDAGDANVPQYKRVQREKLMTPVPSHIARRFAQGNKNQYFFDQQRQKLAFVDRGLRLETKDASPVVAESLVEIAMARGWETLRVKGSKDFRREVWLAAELAGAEVVGYDPTEADKEMLERKLEERGMPKREAAQRAHVDLNAVEPAGAELEKPGEKPVGAAGKKRATPEAAEELATAAAGVVAGRVLAHGAARYQHDERNDESYFVRLEMADGKEREVWGKDLKRAMRDARADVGDNVTLKRTGQEPVVVKEAVRDDKGAVVGSRAKDAVLNGWSVEKARDFRTLDASHSLAKHPDLLGAHATMATTVKALANKYPNMAGKIEERFREGLAQRIERNEPITPPKVSSTKVEQRQEPKQQQRPSPAQERSERTPSRGREAER
ncbi:IncQ plasmid conjugative transfer DNA primase TraO [Candidatus Burkholderia verschuerenii]|uniref:IncQ plasmid conjugative transfer DNA primase TraO n=1 Tax=Candidatus Burkholderia verschuerenii TaxID=242163 RepID=A0A0L0MF54_9BURK|nr:LPD7 domain-containing protein [Candidatus Burkholderia verschuerenii]KND60968.1 IncQ plasmid conjugative transfer DNA primase TraO [Candidatus Burkholderia verschuerenii]